MCGRGGWSLLRDCGLHTGPGSLIGPAGHGEASGRLWGPLIAAAYGLPSHGAAHVEGPSASAVMAKRSCGSNSAALLRCCRAWDSASAARPLRTCTHAPRVGAVPLPTYGRRCMRVARRRHQLHKLLQAQLQLEG